MDGAATPGWAPGETPAVGVTPTPKRGRSRWDETPAGAGFGATPAATPGIGATPAMGMTPGATPMGAMDMPTPSPSQLQQAPTQMTPEQYQVTQALCCALYSRLVLIKSLETLLIPRIPIASASWMPSR